MRVTASVETTTVSRARAPTHLPGAEVRVDGEPARFAEPIRPRVLAVFPRLASQLVADVSRARV